MAGPSAEVAEDLEAATRVRSSYDRTWRNASFPFGRPTVSDNTARGLVRAFDQAGKRVGYFMLCLHPHPGVRWYPAETADHAVDMAETWATYLWREEPAYLWAVIAVRCDEGGRVTVLDALGQRGPVARSRVHGSVRRRDDYVTISVVRQQPFPYRNFFVFESCGTGETGHC